MIPFLTLLKNDIRLFLKDWKACLLLLAAPLLFISYFTYVLTPYLNKSSFIEPFPVALVDLEDSTLTRMLENQVKEIDIFSEIRRLDEKTALEQLSDKDVGGIIILPADLTISVSVGENKPVTVVGSSAMPLQAYVVKNIAQSAANLVSAGQSAIITIYHYDREAGLSGAELDARYNNVIMEYVLEALARNEIFLNSDADTGYSLAPVEYFTAALIIVFMMFAGMPAMKMLTMERSAGITRRLSATPVKMWMMLLSKLIASVLLLTLQFGIIIIFTSKVFNSYWGAPVKNILVLFGAVILAVSAWSMFVASISSSPASADVIGNLGILLMAVAGGSIYPLSSMPGFMRGLSRLTINRWAMDGFMVLFSGNDAAGTGLYSLVLLMMACILMAGSVLIMKLLRRE